MQGFLTSAAFIIVITTENNFDFHLKNKASTCCAHIFTLKYQFQNNSVSTLTYNMANGFGFFSTLPQTSVLGVCKFVKRVWNSTKRADSFTHVQLSTVITTVIYYTK